ncbi:MAG: serine hydrolase, partial [Microbacterium sp.]|nr:serine hydrolase [Microbacterium sp.]
PDDTSSFEGRFAAPWGVLDVVRLGDRLLAVSPVGPEPLAGKDELEVVDDDTLRIASGDGFGSIGELVHYTRDAAGETVRVRGSGGMTMWAFDPARAEGEVPWGTLG